MYGAGKLYGECPGRFCRTRFELDFRSLRLARGVCFCVSERWADDAVSTRAASHPRFGDLLASANPAASNGQSESIVR